MATTHHHHHHDHRRRRLPAYHRPRAPARRCSRQRTRASRSQSKKSVGPAAGSGRPPDAANSPYGPVGLAAAALLNHRPFPFLPWSTRSLRTTAGSILKGLAGALSGCLAVCCSLPGRRGRSLLFRCCLYTLFACFLSTPPPLLSLSLSLSRTSTLRRRLDYLNQQTDKDTKKGYDTKRRRREKKKKKREREKKDQLDGRTLCNI